METEAETSFITDELPEYLGQRFNTLCLFLTWLQQIGCTWNVNPPEEEEDGSTVIDTIYIIIVIHVRFDGVNEAWMKLLSLIEDEQSLRAS